MLKKDDVLFVSYFTEDYHKYAIRLEESLKKHELQHYVHAEQRKGTWIEQVNRKAEFLLMILIHNPKFKAVVWLDADAVVNEFPDALFNIKEDVAYFHMENTNELLSGTLYFRNCRSSLQLLSYWKAQCQMNPKKWDQKNLQAVIESQMWKGSVGELSRDYCFIFDLTDREKHKPVIEHFQASREFSHKGN